MPIVKRNKAKKQLKTNKRINFEHNNVVIQEAMLDYLKRNKGKKLPTYDELSKITGLHHNTIKNHVKEIDFKPTESKFKILNDKVMLNIFNGTYKHTADRKLWMQLMGIYTVKSDTQMAFLIQYINNLDIRELSDEQIRNIAAGRFEEILTKAANTGNNGNGMEIEETTSNG